MTAPLMASSDLTPDIDELPDLQRLALAYARPAERDLWHGLLSLDTHLATLVRKATEPMLGQIRLAWWRDRLREDRAKWPKGNPTLALIDAAWSDRAPQLSPLVDGWEHLLAEPPIGRGDIDGFAAGRAAAMGAIARALGHDDCVTDAETAGKRWALADLFAHSGEGEERSLMLERALAVGAEALTLPRALRPLSILDGMARRSLANDGAPLFAGRRAALAVLRLGMFGR